MVEYVIPYYNFGNYYKKSVGICEFLNTVVVREVNWLILNLSFSLTLIWCSTEQNETKHTF